MKQPPAFQFYPADFLADENVMLMSNHELGCYMKLMCYAWREGSIPSDIGKIAKLCGEDSSAMAQLWLAIGSCFAQASDRDDRLVHPRLDQERMKQQEHRKERAESGKKGAESRWKKVHGSAMQQPMANDGSSSSSSSSSESKEQEKRADALPHTDQAKPSKVRQQPSEAFTPPDWIDPNAWSEYLAMRKKKRAPPTLRACELVVAELTKLRSSGQDPNAVLDQSTRNSWTDVYALKSHGANHATSTPSRNLSAVERVKAANDRAEQRQRDEIDAEYRIVG